MTEQATEAPEGTATETDEATATESAAVTDGEKSLGDAGKKALDTMKAERNTARDEARKAREEADQLRAQIEGKEKEYAAEQERRKIEADALTKANERILRAEVRAAAAGKLSDPADALRFLDLSSFEVGDDGDVDSAKVAEAIDGLITDKPYLAAQSGRFQGSADSGTRNGQKDQPAQLTKQDVDRLYRERRYDEIEKARQEGRLDSLLGA